jgi:hypothetical protein
MSNLRSLLMILALLIAAPAAAETASVESYDGVAETPSGAFLYREHHEVTQSGGVPVRAVTVYYDRSGREIGRLVSDFRSSPYAPAYRFKDVRAGKQESVAVNGRHVDLAYQGEQKSLAVPGGEPLVVGQGLHHFARMNLDRLARETVTVRFVVPSRLDSYAFRIRPMAAPRPGVVRLRIEIDSWLMRQLAPYLEVDYDLTTKRLLSYRGVSNLEGPDGATQKVVIRYTYPGGAS